MSKFVRSSKFRYVQGRSTSPSPPPYPLPRCSLWTPGLRTKTTFMKTSTLHQPPLLTATSSPPTASRAPFAPSSVSLPLPKISLPPLVQSAPAAFMDSAVNPPKFSCSLPPSVNAFLRLLCSSPHSLVLASPILFALSELSWLRFFAIPWKGGGGPFVVHPL